MQPLKLVALDKEDLEVVSAHLQDAVLKVADISYVPKARRFVMLVNRFDWAGSHATEGKARLSYERRRSAIRFENVRGVQQINVQRGVRDAVLSLLMVQFDDKDTPAGYITLVFAGGASIRLDVECIEAEIRDLGPAWRTASRPEHELDELLPGGARTAVAGRKPGEGA